MLSSFVAAACLAIQTQKPTGGLPSFCPALGRELSWDPFGLYALDADRPLTPAGRQIVKDLQEAELGRAESLARYRLRVDPDDLVPAWTMGQILRVRHQGLLEYRRIGEAGIDAPGTIPDQLYRLHVCRVAKQEAMEARSIDQELCRRLDRSMKTLRDRCRLAASALFGLAVGITQVDVFWAKETREILEAYQTAHPKGIDVRLLLCQAYNAGVNYVYKPIVVDGRKVKLNLPDEPKPLKVVEVAQSILRERPDDAVAHYFLGRAEFRLDHPDLATREFRAALSLGTLPPVIERVARRFLANPTPAAFVTKIVY